MTTADPMTTAGQPVDGVVDEGGPGPAAAPGPGGLRARADRLREHRTPFVQATVVRAVKPTSAKAGDRALVLPDGTIEGFVGGTCAESSVRLQSLRVLRAGEPVVLRIVPGELPPDQAGPTGEAEGLVTAHNPCASGGMLEIFLEGVFPPPLVQVAGEAPIARALRSVGAALGYDIRPAAPGEPVGADAAAVVVASHGRDEEPVLTEALRAGVPYVGLVASRRRGAQVLASLDVPARDRERVRTPAGLDIGARTAQEVALSILAQIVAQRRPGAEGQPPARQAAPGPAVPLPPTSTEGARGGPVPSGEVPAGTAAGGEGPPAGGEGPPAGGEGPPAGGEGPPAGADLAPAGGTTETTDPVCGMTVAVAQATPHLPHDGRMWYFCGPGCLQAFADDPARYQG